jgi:hypothetical protein
MPLRVPNSHTDRPVTCSTVYFVTVTFHSTTCSVTSATWGVKSTSFRTGSIHCARRMAAAAPVQAEAQQRPRAVAAVRDVLPERRVARAVRRDVQAARRAVVQAVRRDVRLHQRLPHPQLLVLPHRPPPRRLQRRAASAVRPLRRNSSRLVSFRAVISHSCARSPRPSVLSTRRSPRKRDARRRSKRCRTTSRSKFTTYCIGRKGARGVRPFRVCENMVLSAEC